MTGDVLTIQKTLLANRIAGSKNALRELEEQMYWRRGQIAGFEEAMRDVVKQQREEENES